MRDNDNLASNNQESIGKEYPKLDFSLFIPIYNASQIIKESVQRCYEVLSQLNSNFEIIIVDDHSTDIYSKFEQRFHGIDKSTEKKIRYVSYDRGPSRRENLAKSFHLARYELIGFIDVDLSCDASYLLKAVELLRKESADIVIGSRYIKGAKAKRRPIRRFFSFFYNRVLQAIFKSKIKDHQCGLKIFRRSTALKIVDGMGYDDKYVRGWFWDAEFLIRAQKEGLKVIEMPIEWWYADVSTFDFRRELRCLKSIVKLKKEL